jgi:flagellar biosynthesis protein FliR
MFILWISALLLDAVNILAFLCFCVCLSSVAESTVVHMVIAVFVKFFIVLITEENDDNEI